MPGWFNVIKQIVGSVIKTILQLYFWHLTPH